MNIASTVDKNLAIESRLIWAFALVWQSLRLGMSGVAAGISRLSRDPLCLALCAIFTMLFLRQALILIEDLGLIVGFETDPGSHIAAIEALLHTYNMHSGYHSRYYGWTYFALNFWLLTPLNFCLELLSIPDRKSIYLAIRLILFLLGLASAVSFYELLRLVTRSRGAAFAGALLYILSPICLRYFYFIHPETCGTLFLLLGCIALIRFSAAPDVKLYLVGLICLVLASLSKQIYFFAALPVLVGFLLFHCRLAGRGVLNFAISITFLRILGWSALIAFVILLLIHPFAVLQPKEFLASQNTLSDFIDGSATLPLAEALSQWKVVLLITPLTLIGIPILAISLVVVLIGYLRTKRLDFLLGLINLGGIAFVITLIVTLNRLFVVDYYLQPVVPFIIAALICAICAALRSPMRWLGVIVTAVVGYGLVIIGGLSLAEANDKLATRLNYKASIAYRTYDYIRTNIGPYDRIVYDHIVAMPDALRPHSCHYWQGCGTDAIDTFAPNYVMFDDTFVINNKPMKELDRLKRYVAENHMVLVNTIQSVKVYKKAP